MNKRFLSTIALAGAAAFALTACSTDADPGSSESPAAGGGGTEETITVGFAQTGSESGWRSANTESMKAAFSEENGFELIFNAADNDPAAQIAAVRSFINQGVDAIAAVVIGGTLLTGGRGYVLGSMVGVFVYGTIKTIISFMGAEQSWMQIIVGALLLLFIVVQRAIVARAEGRR
ncbi:hypothetical protein Lsed01_01862 [Demequina sediminis]|uniref:ABC transporter permease n=1 Tax=Demequina sediminis TaxID=1930058 RepID=A0ABP9WJZ3_9MICO|nr:hypothetical protein GCM10025873_14720 [Demequina sediminis]